MKYAMRDMLFYLAYVVIMGLVAHVIGVESRDAWILVFAAYGLILVGDAIMKHFPSNHH